MISLPVTNWLCAECVRSSWLSLCSMPVITGHRDCWACVGRNAGILWVFGLTLWSIDSWSLHDCLTISKGKFWSPYVHNGIFNYTSIVSADSNRSLLCRTSIFPVLSSPDSCSYFSSISLSDNIGRIYLLAISAIRWICVNWEVGINSEQSWII